MSWEYVSVITILGAGFFLAYLSTLFNNKELKLLLILISFWTLPMLFGSSYQVLIVTNATTTINEVLTISSTGYGISVYLAWTVTAIIMILFIIDVIGWLSGERKERGELI